MMLRIHAVVGFALLLAFSGCNCGREKLGRSGVCDPGETQSCGHEAVGECHPGTQTCTYDDAWGPCEGAVDPVAETCDGKDNDCDGTTDDLPDGGLLVQGCYDGPAGTQGVGLCQAGTQFCQGGGWTACDGEVLPAAESCNGLDDDCDGSVDNQPDSGAALSQACYDGPDGTRGVGACSDGTQSCMGGAWTACAGAVLPSPESCNAIDDDCNGRVDDAVAPVPCYDGPAGTSGVGSCHGGFQICSDGGFGACSGEVVPAAQDACDGFDESCDGRVNGGCPCAPGSSIPCYSGPAGTEGVGACRAGVQLCGADGGYQACTGDVRPAAEICNGQDDDCDGTPDNQPGSTAPLSQACYDGAAGTSGVGVCHGGTQTCQASSWGACQNEVVPSAEICDGRDNDCNGSPDNGNPGGGGTCTLNGLKGPCAAGVLACADGGIVCVQTTFPTTESCNGQDDDCDGTPDDFPDGGPLSRSCYDFGSGTPGVGICKRGTQTCSGSSFGSCVGEVGPSPEVCNGVDDDCDGTRDDGVDAGSGSCATGLFGPCAAGHYACGADGGRVCIQDFTGTAPDNDLDGYDSCQDCNDNLASVHPGATEICDGLDNNCNRQIDEGFDSDNDCYTSCGTAYASFAKLADGGCDRTATVDGGTLDPSKVDCNDAKPNVHPDIPCDCGAYDPATNTCGTSANNQDDNCNSELDETCACSNVDADRDGYSPCQGDCNDADPSVHPGAAEVCDGKDDDCNPLTTDNCDVGEPCDFDGGAGQPSPDQCKSRFICATDVSTGVSSCGDLCNSSETGAGVGDGCLAGTVCGANLIASDNDHVCVPSTGSGTRTAGASCTTDAQCRSNTCTGGICTDLCGNDSYCGSAVCTVADFAASPGFSYTEVYGGYCQAAAGTQGQGQTCGSRPNSPHCKWGALSCFNAAGESGTNCHQICCKQSDCPSGDYCGQGPTKSLSATITIDGTAYPVDTGVPACLPRASGQGRRTAGQACTSSLECASDLCDSSGVCLDYCCNDASCPTGLACEFVSLEKGSGHVEQARLCVAQPTKSLYVAAP